MVESSSGNLACYPIATVSEGPGPRVGHSSLLVGNAFIVFGGDTKVDDSDVLDDTLYLLNTCESSSWPRDFTDTCQLPNSGHAPHLLDQSLRADMGTH